MLCLWYRPVAAAPIQLLAWEPPYAAGAAQKRQKKKKKKKKRPFGLGRGSADGFSGEGATLIKDFLISRSLGGRRQG